MKRLAVSIKCPGCNNMRLIDANSEANVETKVIREEHIHADFYIKCWKCKQEIALVVCKD